MADGGEWLEMSEERPPDKKSLEDLLAELDRQLEFASQEYIAEGLTARAEEHYKSQIQGLLALIARLQMEKAGLEERIQTLEARNRWKLWRRGEK
jgi:hypothetical protein